MKLAAIDVRNTASASDLIFDALREAIFTGVLQDGEHLRQDRLAETFNTSRIPVREALARLEQQGLVINERYRGTTVTALSPEEIKEIFEFRALLEGETIRYAVKNISDETLERVKVYCEQFASEPDSAKWGDLNRNIHYTLYESAQRPYYLRTIKSTLDRIERYLRAQLALTDGMERANKEHLGILKACIDRDADLASKLTRDHILGASSSLITFLKQNDTDTDRG